MGQQQVCSPHSITPAPQMHTHTQVCWVIGLTRPQAPKFTCAHTQKNSMTAGPHLAAAAAANNERKKVNPT